MHILLGILLTPINFILHPVDTLHEYVVEKERQQVDRFLKKLDIEYKKPNKETLENE